MVVISGGGDITRERVSTPYSPHLQREPGHPPSSICLASRHPLPARVHKERLQGRVLEQRLYSASADAVK